VKLKCLACGQENVITNLDPEEVHRCCACNAVLKKKPYSVPVKDEEEGVA
jgi:hypothetical protein